MDYLKNVCAGIVTFNPDIKLLEQNIHSILQQVHLVYIFDNGSSNYEQIQRIVEKTEKCILLSEKKNLGIAYGLNVLCSKAHSEKHEWILTLDQDSICPSSLVKILYRYSNTNVAVVAPDIIYKNNEQFHSQIDSEAKEVDWVITSASLTNLEAWEAIGGFDEWLFIDGVDFDFGIRANKAGFKIIKTYKTSILHELGNNLKCVPLFRKIIYITNHSALRKFYMSRNAVYLRKKLKKGNTFTTIVKYICKVLLFEDRKMEKIASIVHGVYDGLKMSPPPKVLVLISTYNGERYIREQLNSILTQIGICVNILIRDDGSKDSTLDILDEYADKHHNIKYYTGSNLGVINSFNNLLMRPELNIFDYIAFCDQDDVWEKDKLLIAISHLMKASKELPTMYCSNLILVDEDLHYKMPMRQKVKNYILHMSLVQNIGTGCTQVFNKCALNLYRKGIGCRMEMHDYWMTLVCMFMGKVIYDENPHIKYRQHGNNVIGASPKKLKTALFNLIGTRTSLRISMLTDFSKTYRLSPSDHSILKEIIDCNSLFNKAKLFFSNKFVGLTPAVTFGFKIRVIMGRIY